MKRICLLICALSLMTGAAFAGGFNIYEFGGRATAMGGAVVARPWDASTLFYNPAGLTYLKGTRFYGGTTLIVPSSRFVGAAPVFPNTVHNVKDALFTPLGVYVSHMFNDRFGAGLSVTNPFGLGVAWHDDFPGRGIAKNTQLQSFYISPVLAYQVSPRFSIGAGADFVLAKVTLERNVYIFDSEGSPGYEVGEVKLEGNSDLAVGFVASAMYRGDKLGFGITYRHSVENKFNDGTADFSVFNNLSVPNVAAVASTVLKDQSASTAITFPSFFSAGVFYQVTDKLGLEVDYVWFNWSVFDKVTLDFQDDALDLSIDENYQDSYQIRVGASYEVNDKLSLRGGYVYDQTPQPVESVSPLLPDANRNDVSFGIGYNFGKYQVDVGYMLVLFQERSTVENGVGKNPEGFNGTYYSRASLLNISFGIEF
ncbi:MAG: type IX secretion system membrane protein PorP/SprF [Calditrichaeota bacterium]|nr:MAG: type IX secretion system membrane protein PorP/SprF [Calditrichota bacterium]